MSSNQKIPTVTLTATDQRIIVQTSSVSVFIRNNGSKLVITSRDRNHLVTTLKTDIMTESHKELLEIVLEP